MLNTLSLATTLVIDWRSTALATSKIGLVHETSTQVEASQHVLLQLVEHCTA